MGQLGKLFESGGLTTPNSAMVDKNGQASAIGTPDQMMLKAGQQLKDTQNANAASDIAGSPQAPAQVPHLGTPSFAQAATAGAPPGAGNAMSPGLNKAGKLAVLLTNGLQGALAGRAASEQAVLQSGGHRGGGVGTGFEAGMAMPWQRAGMAQDLAQKQAQTRVTQQQGDLVQTPGGPMPLSLAKVFYPAEIRAGAQENAAQTRAGAQVQGAQIGAGARTGAAQIGADARIKAAELNLGPIAQVPQDLQQQFGLPAELPLKMLNQAETAANKPLTIVQGENGPAIVNKAQAGKGVGGTPRNLGIGSPRLGGGTQVGDPNNPGDTRFTTMGNAVRNGAAGPQSASVQAPKAVIKSATSGPIATQITAFNTALQHADLLEKGLTALNNGDTRSLNSLKNFFRTEFGSADVTNVQAITNAYSREITKMLSAGHMTDAEIGSSGATMPTNASPQQMLGALQAYRKLATSKMQQLQGQVDQGMKGKPNFQANLGGAPVIHYVIQNGKLIPQAAQ